MSKKCVKKVENPNVPYPQCERSIKMSVFKQQCVPNTGTKNAENGGNCGKIRGKFARCARCTNVLSLCLTNVKSTNSGARKPAPFLTNEQTNYCLGFQKLVTRISGWFAVVSEWTPKAQVTLLNRRMRRTAAMWGQHKEHCKHQHLLQHFVLSLTESSGGGTSWQKHSLM